MAAWMESVCVHDERGSEGQLGGTQEEREGNRVSAFHPESHTFLALALAASLSPASITLLPKHLHAFRALLFSLNPACVNTTACKHNHDL